jgi:hypothetical protein
VTPQAVLQRGRATRERIKEASSMGSVGIYLDFYLASAVMQFVFWAMLILRYYFGIEEGGADAGIAKISTFSVIVAMGLGWLMLVALGTGFSLWPVLYKVTPFSPSLPRVVLWVNVLGQCLIGISHLMLIEHLETATQVLLIGTTMICFSIALTATVALKLLRMGLYRSIDDGGPPFITVILCLIISVTTMVALLTMNASKELSFFTEGIFILFNIDLLWMSIGFTCALGHFGRRLEWPVLGPLRSKFGFKLLLLAFAIHITVMLADHSGWNHLWWIQLPFILPLLTIFFLLSPATLVRNALSSRSYSRPMLAAVMWMPVIALIAVYEALYMNSGLESARYLLLFGVGIQSLFGFAIWYHQDHKHQPMHDRRQPWLFLISLNGSLLFHVTHFTQETLEWTILGNHHILDGLDLALLLVAMVSWLAWWLWELLFSLHDWHRLPMFYTTIHEADDPYEVKGAD